MAGGPPSGFERAKIDVDGGDTIDCWFNPTEYSITKANRWEFKTAPGTALPPAQFAGGMPRMLTLELLFDATDTEDKDVKEATDKLLKMMEVPGGGRPPMVTFVWGQMNSFKAVPENLHLRYSLFRPNGNPMRAHASLMLAQAEKTQDASATPGGTPGGGNPTTRGIDAIGAHVVRDGDSLASIAYKAYGDPTQWRPIAEANGIDDPVRLRRGSSLAIPRLEE